MKISTRGEYGARAMVELAFRYGGEPISVKEIARRQEIPEGYLEHLLNALQKAGLVKSVRGAKGGYALAKPPQEIKLSEVIKVLEGSISPVECLDNAKACHLSDRCVTREVWKEVKEGMISVLQSTTLEALAERQREKERIRGYMYYV